MELLSRDKFADLANHQDTACITIYIPTHNAGVEVNEKHDVILFKNNLQQAKVLLAEKGLDQTGIDKILKPGFELLKNEDFWHSQNHGLAAYMSSSFFQVIRLPNAVKEEIFVNSGFFLSPLLPIMANRCLFYLLVLSRHDAQLYEGDQYEMRKIEVEGLPNGIDDVIHYEEKGGKQLLRKGGTSPGMDASYHGHGTGLADDNEYVLKYLKEVDQTLWSEVLGRQKAPLVIAAVDYMAALYKQVTRYKYVWEDVITGNYEYLDQNSLYQKAKEKLVPYFKEHVNKALKNYYDNSATDLTISIPEEVIPASYYGQISDLFVKKDEHIWGKFNEKDNILEIHEEKQPDDECLINKAIIKTIMNGGDVHILEKEKMPADSKLAAFLRFSL